MKKIKIIFYTHELDYAGTARSHERIVESLNRDIFEPYVFYWVDCHNNPRLPIVEKLVGKDHLIGFYRSNEKTGPEEGYTPLWSDFYERAMEVKPDIIHCARSGYYEYPLNKRIAPLQVETNIFAHKDESAFLDRSICISNCIDYIRQGSDAVIYNPIPAARLEGDSLRRQYDIPEDAVVCGRIGRPSNYHPFALEAFKRAVKKYPNLWYINIAPCRVFMQEAQGVPNVVLIPPTSDDSFIEKFHRTIDIFAHYRLDGECCSTAIQQAMMYGLPVISHISKSYNGQIETIGNGGFVARTADEYYDFLCHLVEFKQMREDFGQRARARALAEFDQEIIVRKIEDCYMKWLDKTKE